MTLPAGRVIGHKEWTGRKSDPRHAMSWRRDRVNRFTPRGRGGFDVAGSILAAYNRVVINLATWAFFLGLPKGPEVPTWDKVGRWQEFAKGIIMWHPTITAGPGERPGTAHVVWGAILTRFWALGAEPMVGYPVTDELTCPDGVGKMSHFKGGRHGDASIYWRKGRGAHPVWGLFRQAWGASGWERGPWGYPTSAEFVVDGRTVQDFDRGRVTLDGGRAVFTARA